VTSSHLIVQLRDSSSELNVSELAVLRREFRTRRVTQPDAVILDDASVLLNKLYSQGFHQWSSSSYGTGACSTELGLMMTG
jgi:hypothetical protein